MGLGVWPGGVGLFPGVAVGVECGVALGVGFGVATGVGVGVDVGGVANPEVVNEISFEGWLSTPAAL